MKSLKFNKQLIIVALVIGVFLSIMLSACSTSNNTTSTPSSPTSNTPASTIAGNPVTIDLSAQNMAFDKSTITVPAGAQVTLNFNNKDGGIPHNFAVYTDSSAANVIFKGNIITGAATATYTFTAPTTPGTYFFRCDIHPQIMTGQFIVQ